MLLITLMITLVAVLIQWILITASVSSNLDKSYWGLKILASTSILCLVLISMIMSLEKVDAAQNLINKYKVIEATACENMCSRYPWEDQEDYVSHWNTDTLTCECTVVLETP